MQIMLSPHCSSHQLAKQIDLQKLYVYDQFSETRAILNLLKAFLNIKSFKDVRILHVESGFVLQVIYYFSYFSETCQRRERQSERKICYLRISHSAPCLPPPTPQPNPPPPPPHSAPTPNFANAQGCLHFSLLKPVDSPLIEELGK